MRRKQALSLILVILCMLLTPLPKCYGQQEKEEFQIQKDLNFTLELLSPISTATNQKGDTFSCKVIEPPAYANAIVGGYIKKLKRSGKANGKAEIDISFDTITMPDGRSGGFNAQVTEVYEVAGAGNSGRADAEGTVKSKSRVKVSVKRAVAGALIGGIIGGVIAGGQGAAVGAAIGASVGVTSVLATDGPDLEFKQGTQFKVLTNAPARKEKREKVEPTAATANTTAAPLPDKVTVEPAPVAAVQTPTAVEVSKTELKEQKPTAVKEQKSAVVKEQKPSVVKEQRPLAVKEPQPAIAPGPLRITPPRLPSTRTRAYASGTLFRLSVPVNWRESASDNPVTFAPEGGYIPYQEKLTLLYGVRVGFIKAQEGDLQQASTRFINEILQSNPYLNREGAPRDGKLATRPSLSTTLAGTSNVTARVEVVNIHTTLLRNGDLFYLVTVVPQDESGAYQSAFQQLLLSLQISD